LLLHDNNTLLVLGGLPHTNRAAEGSTNHFLGAACPAFVKTWVLDQNGQVVAAPVVARIRAGWTARDIVPSNLPHSTDVRQDAKVRLVTPTPTVKSGPARCRGADRRGTLLSGDEPSQFFLGDFSQPVEVIDLVLQRVISAVEPESAVGATVDSQGSANGVAKFSGANGVVFRKHLDAVRQARTLHRHSQLQGKIMDVDPTLSCQQRRRQKDPKMP